MTFVKLYHSTYTSNAVPLGIAAEVAEARAEAGQGRGPQWARGEGEGGDIDWPSS